jgi:elongation factor G
MPSPLTGASAGVESIRTLALVGPAAAGKTSLAEALLAASGAIVTPGTLERGTTVSDFDPLERRMQHSLNASVLHLTRGETRVHFIDTPGAPISSARACPRSRRSRRRRSSSTRRSASSRWRSA